MTKILMCVVFACGCGASSPSSATVAKASADALCVLQSTPETTKIMADKTTTDAQKAELMLLEVAPQLAACLASANAAK